MILVIVMIFVISSSSPSPSPSSSQPSSSSYSSSSSSSSSSGYLIPTEPAFMKWVTIWLYKVPPSGYHFIRTEVLSRGHVCSRPLLACSHHVFLFDDMFLNVGGCGKEMSEPQGVCCTEPFYKNSFAMFFLRECVQSIKNRPDECFSISLKQKHPELAVNSKFTIIL